MLADGAQLCRPPQLFVIAPASAADPNNVGIWGAHQTGNGNVPGTAATLSPWVKSMISGRLTNVVYGDGHVKTVRTQKLYSRNYVFENGAWKGEAPDNFTGWARDW